MPVMNAGNYLKAPAVFDRTIALPAEQAPLPSSSHSDYHYNTKTPHHEIHLHRA
jgi:hypothetical protein